MTLLTKTPNTHLLMSLSRASSFSATSSSASSSRYDNSTMVTSRNLQCMPSDDEDDFEEEEEEEDDDEDYEDHQKQDKRDSLVLCDTIKHPFFSIESESPANHHARKNDNAKKMNSNSNSNSSSSSGSSDSSDFGPKRQQQKKALGAVHHQPQQPHIQQQQKWYQKQQQRHSIGLPINDHHISHAPSRYSTHPNTCHQNSRQHKSMMVAPTAPLLSVNLTPPSTPTTPTLNFNNTTPLLSQYQQQQPTGTSSQYLRHRSSLSGVDLIMAREQFEQQKKKTKQKKRWDSTHAPIGGLLAQLPQQGQHTISFQQHQQQQQQQQQQQLYSYQQQQMQQIQYQQQVLQQMQHHVSNPYRRHMNPSPLPRSPTSSMARW